MREASPNRGIWGVLPRPITQAIWVSHTQREGYEFYQKDKTLNVNTSHTTYLNCLFYLTTFIRHVLKNLIKENRRKCLLYVQYNRLAIIIQYRQCT